MHGNADRQVHRAAALWWRRTRSRRRHPGAACWRRFPSAVPARPRRGSASALPGCVPITDASTDTAMFADACTPCVTTAPGPTAHRCRRAGARSRRLRVIGVKHGRRRPDAARGLSHGRSARPDRGRRLHGCIALRPPPPTGTFAGSLASTYEWPAWVITPRSLQSRCRLDGHAPRSATASVGSMPPRCSPQSISIRNEQRDLVLGREARAAATTSAESVIRIKVGAGRHDARRMRELVRHDGRRIEDVEKPAFGEVLRLLQRRHRDAERRTACRDLRHIDATSASSHAAATRRRAPHSARASSRSSSPAGRDRGSDAAFRASAMKFGATASHKLQKRPQRGFHKVRRLSIDARQAHAVVPVDWRMPRRPSRPEHRPPNLRRTACAPAQVPSLRQHGAR